MRDESDELVGTHRTEAVLEVLLDVDEHPRRVGAGGDGVERQVVLATVDDERHTFGAHRRRFGEAGRGRRRGQQRQRRVDPAISAADGSSGTRSGSGK